VWRKKRHGFVLICEMETGTAVDILYYKPHLIIRNSVRLGT